MNASLWWLRNMLRIELTEREMLTLASAMDDRLGRNLRVERTEAQIISDMIAFLVVFESYQRVLVLFNASRVLGGVHGSSGHPEPKTPSAKAPWSRSQGTPAPSRRALPLDLGPPGLRKGSGLLCEHHFAGGE